MDHGTLVRLQHPLAPQRFSAGDGRTAPVRQCWRGGTAAAASHILRRWAHVARRTRWPLLRNIVAASLRCTFDPQALDQLPLPTDTPTRFELVCLVRVLRCLEPRPRSIRWLVWDLGNEIRTPGTTCRFEHTFPREHVIGHFDAALGAAIERQHAGFDGMLIEAKSGAQQFGATLAQLQTYHAVLRKRHGGRWLVWGVIENHPDGTSITEEQESEVHSAGTGQAIVAGDSVWIFFTADDIDAVMKATGLTAPV